MYNSEASDAGMLNIAAVVGETVTFTCIYDFTANPTLSWSYYRPQDASKRHLISFHNVTLPHFVGRFKTDFDVQNGLSKLSITDVQMADSGMYMCERRLKDGSMAWLSADLTVLGETVAIHSRARS